MKKPYPWFRCGRGWYVEIDETQHFLGRHPDDAPPPQKSKKTRLWNPPPSILDAFYEKMWELKQGTAPPLSVEPCQLCPPKVSSVVRGLLSVARCPWQMTTDHGQRTTGAPTPSRPSRGSPSRAGGER